MAISHGLGCPGDFEFDRTAKAASSVSHCRSSTLPEVGILQPATADCVRYSAEHAALWNRVSDGPLSTGAVPRLVGKYHRIRSKSSGRGGRTANRRDASDGPRPRLWRAWTRALGS